jgi:hypothetical protein
MGWFDYISPLSEASKQEGIRVDFNKPVYLQFVPGEVIDVVYTSGMNGDGKSDSYTSPRDINAILARSHTSDAIEFKALVRQKYYPLLRGIVDTPMPGDQVLLCEFGGENYYIGPVNTINSPNWNVNHLVTGDPKYSSWDNNPVNEMDRLGLQQTFQLSTIPRMQKRYIKKLDDPLDSIEQNETHGDMLFEGRHGNSIRIGSRFVNPYITISNARDPNHITESIFDGSLITMLSGGSLLENFPSEIEFNLGSEHIDLENSRTICGGNDGDQITFNKNYGTIDDLPIFKNQIYISSDRITLNAKDNNITISAKNNIDLGSGNNMTINTKEKLVMESRNIFFGKKSTDKKEPIVLGEELRKILLEMASVFELIKTTGTIGGISGPLTPDGMSKVAKIKSQLSIPQSSTFQSKHHYIEGNESKQ